MPSSDSRPMPPAFFRADVVGLILLSVLCLGTRAAHVWFEHVQRRQQGIEHQRFESEVIAANLVAGRGYSYLYYGKLLPTANAPPGLVFALAALYALGVPEPNLVFQFIQVATSSGAMLLTWGLARRAFGRAVAWWAATLFVLDVNLSYTTVWIQETALNVFFTLAGLALLVAVAEKPTLRRALLCGAVFGCGMLVRPTVASIWVVGLAWLIFQARRVNGNEKESGLGKFFPDEVSTREAWSSRHPSTISSPKPLSLNADAPRDASGLRRLAAALWVLLAAALVVGPWTLRNALVFKRWIPVSQNFGLSLWYGNNPKAAGSQVDAQGLDLKPEGELLAALQSARDEAEMDGIYRRAALQFIRAHPGQALWLRIKCFAYFWLDHNYWLPKQPVAGNSRAYPAPWWLFLGNVALVALTAVALAAQRRSRAVAALLWWSIVASCLTYTMIHADLGNRYRMPIEPLMLILVASLVVSLGKRLREVLIQRFPSLPLM